MTKTTGSGKKQTSKSAIVTQENLKEYSNYLYSVFYNRVKDILSSNNINSLDKLDKIVLWVEFVEEVKREKQEEIENYIKKFLKN